MVICKVPPGRQAFSCSCSVLKASELCLSPCPFSLMPRRGRNHLYSSHSVSGGGEGPSATSGETKSMRHGAQQNCATRVTNSIQRFCGRALDMPRNDKASSAKLLALFQNTTMWYSHQD